MINAEALYLFKYVAYYLDKDTPSFGLHMSTALQIIDLFAYNVIDLVCIGNMDIHCCRAGITLLFKSICLICIILVL